jgi:hypothetical protein
MLVALAWLVVKFFLFGIILSFLGFVTKWTWRKCTFRFYGNLWGVGWGLHLVFVQRPVSKQWVVKRSHFTMLLPKNVFCFLMKNIILSLAACAKMWVPWVCWNVAHDVGSECRFSSLSLLPHKVFPLLIIPFAVDLLCSSVKYLIVFVLVNVNLLCRFSERA